VGETLSGTPGNIPKIVVKILRNMEITPEEHLSPCC